MQIRKASMDDYDLLSEIKLKAKRSERTFNKSLKPIDEVRERYLSYLKNDLTLRDRAVFVVVENGKVAGMVTGRVSGTLSIVRSRKMGSISNLYVLPGHRRKGTAKQLTGALLAWFREKKIRDIRLEVYPKNTPAINIYRDFGFREYSIRMKKSL